MKKLFVYLSVTLLAISQLSAKTIEVISNADNGPGSLREAFSTARDGDTIFINVVGNIQLLSTIDVPDSTYRIYGVSKDETKIDGTILNAPLFNFKGFSFGQGEPRGQEQPLALSPGVTSVEDMSFVGSSSDSVGGACYIEAFRSINFLRVSFQSNSALIDGGALAFLGDNVVNIDRCEFLSNTAKGNGGAIYTSDYVDLAIRHTIFKGNTTTDFNGGALYIQNPSFFDAFQCTFDNNAAGESGGAFYNAFGGSGVYFNQCVFFQNEAESLAGAVYISDFVNASITSSTFESNFAKVYGGALSGAGSNTIKQCTFSGNGTSGQGTFLSNRDGGTWDLLYTTIYDTSSIAKLVIDNEMGDVNFTGVVMARANPTLLDMISFGESSISSNGYNFIESPGSAISSFFSGPGDTVGLIVPIDPRLRPLANNGGFTKTHEPEVGSPLIDAGGDAGNSPAFLYEDQRGNPWQRTYAGSTDIGSFETQILPCNDGEVSFYDDRDSCGTLRYAIHWANQNPGVDQIRFVLPGGFMPQRDPYIDSAIVMLEDSILVTDSLILVGVTEFMGTPVSIHSKTGSNHHGLVFKGNSGGSNIIGLNFQNFGANAILVNGVDSVKIQRNSFGTITDSLGLGNPNFKAVVITNSNGSSVGGANTQNYFAGNGIGVQVTGGSGNTISQNLFYCQSTSAITSTYNVPVIDTLRPSYIQGVALPNDIIEIYADSSCTKDQGSIYISSVVADASGKWLYNGTFYDSLTYTVTATSELGATSPFSAPMNVEQCPLTLDFDAGDTLYVCGDSVEIQPVKVPPVGYESTWIDLFESVSFSDEGVTDTVSVSNLAVGENKLVWEPYNGLCFFSDTLIVISDSIPSEAIAGNDSEFCEDSLQLIAVAPGSGTGLWEIKSGSVTAVIVDSSQAVTTIQNISQGDSIQLTWTVSNGVCPVKVDTLTLERSVAFTPQVTIALVASADCPGDSVKYLATPNYTLGGQDNIDWFINKQYVSSGLSFSNNSVAVGDSIFAILSSGLACVTTPLDSSNVEIVQQFPHAVGGDLVANETIACHGLSSQLELLNALGTAYTWYESVDGSSYSVSGNTVIDDTLMTHVHDNVTTKSDTSWYYVSVRTGCDTISSDTVTVITYPESESASLTATSVTCPGETATLYSEPANFVGDSIRWQTNATGAWQDVIGSDSLSLSIVDTIKSRLIVGYKSGVCDADTTAELEIFPAIVDLEVADDSISIIAADTIDIDVLLNDVISGSILTQLYTTSSPTSGSVFVQGDNKINYAATVGFKGAVSFEYVVSNACLMLDTATVKVTLTNNAPTGSDVTVLIASGEKATTDLTTMISDVDNNLIISSATVASSTNGSVVTSVIGNNIEVDYATIPTYQGIDTISVVVKDEGGDSVVVNFIVETKNVFADAGQDQTIDTTSTIMTAVPVPGFIGTWSTSKTGLVFADVNNATTEVVGFDPILSPYELVWSVDDNGTILRDTVIITVINVPPVAKIVALPIVLDTDTIITITDLVTDPNQNVATIEIIKKFSKLKDSSVVINSEALTITFDPTVNDFSPNDAIHDTLVYEVCDELGECDQSVLIFGREGLIVDTVAREIKDPIVYNLLTPNDDQYNSVYLFDVITEQGEFSVVTSDGQVVSRDEEQYKALFTSQIDHIELIIFNRWGDEVNRIDDYYGGKAFVNGETSERVVEEEYLWRGEDQDGQLLPPGTYYYYIQIFGRQGLEKDNTGFVELRY